jgi:hypothetical protein
MADVQQECSLLFVHSTKGLALSGRRMPILEVVYWRGLFQKVDHLLQEEKSPRDLSLHPVQQQKSPFLYKLSRVASRMSENPRVLFQIAHKPHLPPSRIP